MTIQPQNSKLNYLIDPYYLTDCFFCHLQEMLKEIVEIPSPIFVYRASK